MASDEKRYSVERWRGDALQAAAMHVGACNHPGIRMIGIDMVAQNGDVFAHGHFDLETAVAFVEQMQAAISEALGH